MTKKDKNSLNLVGDGDDTDLIEEVEAAFDIKITNAESENIETTGDLFELLVQKLGANHKQRTVCFTAISFYRLRRIFKEISNFQDITPRTKINKLLPGGKFLPFRENIEASTGLKLPFNEVDYTAYLESILIIASPALAWLFFDTMGWASLIFLIGWALIIPISMYFYNRAPLLYSDVGDLAKVVAGLNFKRLNQEYGDCHQDDLWNALVYTLLDKTDAEGTFETINQKTKFY